MNKDVPIGIVSGIHDDIRHCVARIDGQTTHAGGVPGKNRSDAVLAGAEAVDALKDWWVQNENLGKDFVLTIGKLTTDPAQHGITKVPGAVLFTIDARSKSDPIL